jgi:hypothetical protein
MKTSVVIVVLAIFGLGVLSTTSCLVNRRSEDYACDDEADCHDGRVCESGYCVRSGSCNPAERTCEFQCSASKPCGVIQCPTGFDCTIKCSNANACGEIDCRTAGGCDISCAGSAACGAITCGALACEIDCSGAASCGAVNCADSCGCDVRCNNAACPTMACPQISSLYCTRDGTANTPCASSNDPACDTCP